MNESTYYHALALKVSRIVRARRANEALHMSKPVKVECPVCMEEFISIQSSMCGHKVCSPCCRRMRDSGRTLSCPMCRDMRFKFFVELMVCN